MFNLEKSIADWRKQMLAAGILPSALEELESHLREEIGLQIKSGINTQQAFEAAVQEIGKANMLNQEFKKNGTTPVLLERLMIGICLLFLALIAFLGGAMVVTYYSSLSDRILAAAAMTCTVAVACLWRHAVPRLPLIAGTGKRVVMSLACMAFGCIAGTAYFQCVLHYLTSGSAESVLPAIGLWAVFIVAVFTCGGIGLCLSAKDREMYGMTKKACGFIVGPV